MHTAISFVLVFVIAALVFGVIEHVISRRRHEPFNVVWWSTVSLSITLGWIVSATL